MIEPNLEPNGYFGRLFGRSCATSLWASYPGFVQRPWAEGFPYIFFTHGHLLDPLVRGIEDDWKYLALGALGCPRPRVPVDAREVRSVGEVARLTDPFSLALWERYSRRDYAYSNYVMRRLERPDSCPLQVGHDGIVSVIPALDPSSPRDGIMASAPWFLDVMMADPGLPTPVGELRAHNPGVAFVRPSCLVYGHDHLGSARTVASAGAPFRVVDSGGWTSEHEGHLPHSHVLGWWDPGQVAPETYLLRTRLGGET